MRTWLRRPSRIPRRLRAALAILLGAVALMMWSQVASAPARDAQRFATIKPASTSQVIGQGQRLYAQSCASCHGLNLRGRRDTAPSLFGVGAGAVQVVVTRHGQVVWDSAACKPAPAKRANSGWKARIMSSPMAM